MTNIKNMDIYMVPDEETRLDREFMDDVIRESMEDMGNFRHPFLQTGINHSRGSSTNQIENNLMNDCIAETERDYNIGITKHIKK